MAESALRRHEWRGTAGNRCYNLLVRKREYVEEKGSLKSARPVKNERGPERYVWVGLNEVGRERLPVGREHGKEG